MKHLLALTILAAPMGMLQAQEPTLKARELFYTPPPDTAKPVAAAKEPEAKAATKSVPTKSVATKGTAKAGDTHTLSASVPLGLRYAVLKRDAGGQYNEVDPDTSFRSGDRIRLKSNIPSMPGVRDKRRHSSAKLICSQRILPAAKTSVSHPSSGSLNMLVK